MAHVPSAAELTHHLKGMHFPAGKNDLKKHVKSQHAPAEVVRAIENLPGDNFNTITDVTRAYGQEDRSKLAGEERKKAAGGTRKGSHH